MALWGQLMGELEMPSSPETQAAQAAGKETRLEPDSGPSFNNSITPEPVAELVLDDVAAGDPLEISLDLEADLEPSSDFDDLDLDLDEVSHSEVLETTERVLPEPTSAEPGPAPIQPQQQLSKFRNAPGDTASGQTSGDGMVREGSEGSPLGRIPIVRVRREGSKRVPYLARLLSSF
jgi:hypothetical protein